MVGALVELLKARDWPWPNSNKGFLSSQPNINLGIWANQTQIRILGLDKLTLIVLLGVLPNWQIRSWRFLQDVYSFPYWIDYSLNDVQILGLWRDWVSELYEINANLREQIGYGLGTISEPCLRLAEPKHGVWGLASHSLGSLGPGFVFSQTQIEILMNRVLVLGLTWVEFHIGVNYLCTSIMMDRCEVSSYCMRPNNGSVLTYMNGDPPFCPM